jgi:hypothetical protein
VCERRDGDMARVGDRRYPIESLALQRRRTISCRSETVSSRKPRWCFSRRGISSSSCAARLVTGVGPSSEGATFRTRD